MKSVILFTSLVLALPVAVVAFYLGNFTVLLSLCAYVTATSIVICIASLTHTTSEPSYELDEI